MLSRATSSAAFTAILTVSIVPAVLVDPFKNIVTSQMDGHTVVITLSVVSKVIALLTAIFFTLSKFGVLTVTVVRVILTMLSTVRAPIIRSTLPRVVKERSSASLHQNTTVVGRIRRLDRLLPDFLNNIVCKLINVQPVVLVATTYLLSTTVIRYFVELTGPLSGRSSTNVYLLSIVVNSVRSTATFLLHGRPAMTQLTNIYA